MRYHVMYSSNKEGIEVSISLPPTEMEKDKPGKIFIANVEMRRCCLRQTLLLYKKLKPRLKLLIVRLQQLI